MMRIVLAMIIFQVLMVLQSGAQQYRFTQLIDNDNTGQLQFNTLLQDKDGVFWIGTSQGILAFDGSVVYKVPSRDIYDITALFSDPEGVIWAGSAGGELLAIKQDSLLKVSSGENEISSRITALFANDRSDILVISYRDGIWLYNNDQAEFNSVYSARSDIYSAREDNYGRMWLGTDNGAEVCFFAGDSAHCRKIGDAEGLTDQIVLSLAADPDGRMWLGTFDEGIFTALSGDSVAPVHTFDWDHGRVTSLNVPSAHEIWAGTLLDGVFLASLGGDVEKVAVSPAATGQISSVFPDDEGNIWVLDKYSGLFKANRSLTVLEPDVANIQALYNLSRDSLLIGTDEGLFVLDLESGTTRKVQLRADPVNVLAISRDINGLFWIGTFGQGLFSYDHQSGEVSRFGKGHGLTDESILSISGNASRMWLATLGGVTELVFTEPGKFEAINYNDTDGLGANFIYCAFVDSKNRVWFGTDGQGLSVLDNGKINNYSGVDSTDFHSIYSIVEGGDGLIWFSTDDHGVWYYDGNSFHQGNVNGLSVGSEVASIGCDDQGNVLLSADGSLTLFNIGNNVLRHYGAESGIQSFSPNLNAVHSDHEGNVWFGGRTFILKYRPVDGISRNQPVTGITEVTNGLLKVDQNAAANFTYHNNSVSFTFRGIWYTRPEDVRYRYRLEGEHSDWRTTSDRNVSYQNLAPGKYTFVLQSSASAEFGGSEDRYSFTIKPPYYATWWFILLVVLTVLVIIRTIIVQRDKRLQRIAEFNRSQIESQYETLKAQINPHFLFNIFNSLLSVIEDDPGAAVRYVEKLSDFYRSIIELRDSSVISLREELRIVDDYVFLLKMRYEDNLRVDIDIKDDGLRILPLTLQMLVENAVKHNIISTSKPLFISIYREGGYVVVKNPLQVKSSTQPSTSFGLSSIAERYRLITGEPLVVEDSSGEFVVKIPVIKEDESTYH